MAPKASKWRLAGAALFLLSAGSLNAHTVTTDAKARSVTRDMQSLPVHVGGRVKEEALSRSLPSGSRGYSHQWPGVYFEAAFRGDSVTLRFDDKANEYRLLIDDLVPIAIPQPGRADITIGDLPPEPHRVRLEKITENDGSIAKFGGFYVPAGATPMAVQSRARQIEFVGDSSMTGFGMHSPTRECSSAEARLRSDAQNAYPALVARHFDADYQINAISARGVVRNYMGMLPDAVLPAVYPYTFWDKTVPYRDTSWQPEIIVVKLNADFVGALQPTEKWKSFEAVAEDYGTGYGAFIADLHKRSPSAAFLVWWFDLDSMPDGGVRQSLEAARRKVMDAAHADGIAKIDFLPIQNLGFDNQACSNHYSVADHKKVASWLIDYLDTRPALWQGK